MKATRTFSNVTKSYITRRYNNWYKEQKSFWLYTGVEKKVSHIICHPLPEKPIRGLKTYIVLPVGLKIKVTAFKTKEIMNNKDFEIKHINYSTAKDIQKKQRIYLVPLQMERHNNGGLFYQKPQQDCKYYEATTN